MRGATKGRVMLPWIDLTQKQVMAGVATSGWAGCCPLTASFDVTTCVSKGIWVRESGRHG
jgi:hypothetical protein